MNDFNIHNPSVDDIEDLVSEVGRLAAENPGRQVLHTFTKLDDRTSKLYEAYIQDLFLKIGQVRDTQLPRLEMGVKSIKYYEDSDIGGSGGWVTEYVIQAKLKDS